jgi:hypothetical protein
MALRRSKKQLVLICTKSTTPDFAPCQSQKKMRNQSTRFFPDDPQQYSSVTVQQ